MRQETLSAPKLRQFEYFLERMEDLTTKNLGNLWQGGRSGKTITGRILQVCCEEQIWEIGEAVDKDDGRTTGGTAGDAGGRKQG